MSSSTTVERRCDACIRCASEYATIFCSLVVRCRKLFSLRITSSIVHWMGTSIRTAQMETEYSKEWKEKLQEWKMIVRKSGTNWMRWKSIYFQWVSTFDSDPTAEFQMEFLQRSSFRYPASLVQAFIQACCTHTREMYWINELNLFYGYITVEWPGQQKNTNCM